MQFYLWGFLSQLTPYERWPALASLGIMNDDIYETPNVGTDALYSNYVRQKKYGISILGIHVKCTKYGVLCRGK